MQEKTSDTTEQQAEVPPINPREYFADFLNSEGFLAKKAERLEKIHLRNPNLTVDDLKDAVDAFLRTDETKDEFWKYFRRHPFKYDPQLFSPIFNTKLNAYFVELKKIKSKERLMRGPATAEEILEQDELRSAKHTVASEQLLADGIAPNFTLARLLTHMITVQEGLDKEDPDRDRRVREVLAARR